MGEGRRGKRANELHATGREVARNVRRLRDARGLSTTELSRLLAEVGRPILPTGITKIEQGDRRVDVDDLMALAVVLRVHPSALLLPPLADDTEIEITGGGRVHARDTWNWAEGKRPLYVPADDDGEAHADFQTHARPRGRRTYQPGLPASRRQLFEDTDAEVTYQGGDTWKVTPRTPQAAEKVRRAAEAHGLSQEGGDEREGGERG